MDRQNVTLSIPKEVLKRAKHIAIERQTSLSGLLTDSLVRLVEEDKSYQHARSRQLMMMEKGYNLGLKGKAGWSREEIHER